MKDNIVYSTEKGDLRSGAAAQKQKKKSPPAKPVKKDGIVRVQRESKGRGGKTVSVITGMPLSGEKLDAFASELKRSLGSGGSVASGEVIIQGDRVEAIIKFISGLGFPVKRSGG